jgi:DNA replication protein DnaC
MTICTLCGGSGVRYYPREGLPDAAAECVCRKRERAERRAVALREASGVSETLFERFTFDTFLPEQALSPRCDMAAAKRACQEFAALPKGWLVLAGSYGVGKTHLAYAIAGALLRRAVPVYAASVPEMLTMIRGGFSDRQGYTAEQRLAALRTIEVLVLDDWGTEKGSDWVSETMFTVLNSRYNERLATVITTNLSPTELAQRDARLASRLLDAGLSRVLVLVAGDYRRRA